MLEIDGFSVATALDEDVLEADRQGHGRHVPAGRGRRVARGDLQVDRPRVQARREAARGDRAVRRRRRAPPRARLAALDRVVRAGDLRCRSRGRSRCCRCSSPPRSSLAYWWMLRRRRKRAVRYSSVALLRSVLPKRKRWQRHLPVALLLASLVAARGRRRSPARGAQRSVRADVGRSSRWTSPGRCARPTSSPTGWPSRRTPPASSSRTSRRAFGWPSSSSRASRS